MTAVETIKTDKTKVSCNGGSDASGHPKVYLNMGKNKNVECPYCGKNFILKKAP